MTLRLNDRVMIPGVPVWHGGTCTQVLGHGRVVITWDTVRDPETGRNIRAQHEYSRERAEAIERITEALSVSEAKP